MQTIQSVALIGMGALGILYGHTMARKMKQGAVTFLVDEKRKQRYHAALPFVILRTTPVKLNC